MALRSGYKGFKKLINGLKVLRPGVLGIDIGTGLAIGQDGKLNVTGVDVTVAGNPEEAATAGDLTKLQIGDDIFNVPDTTYSNATTTEAGLMSASDKTALNGLTTSQSITVSEVTGLTAYELSDSATAVYQIGKMVFVRFNLKSLTEDGAPSGRSWIDVIEGLPRPLYNVNLTLVSGKTTGNDAQIFIPNVGNNYNLQARGGTPNDVYFVLFSYIAA